MGRDTDFDFGHAAPGSVAEYFDECMGRIECPRCGRMHGYCKEIEDRKKQLTQPKGTTGMKVGQFITGGQGERLPFIEAKHVGSGAKVKILAARAVTTPKFQGIFLDVKLGDKKFSKSLSFDRGAIDLGNVVAQLGTDDTDDWIGESINLVVKKGSKGGKFVNVAPGKRKK